MPLSYYEISRSAIAANIRAIRQHIGDGVLLCPVVKANAYGHGAVEVARTVLAAGADRIAVNRVGEGVELRQAGISAPILVMGYALAEEMSAVVEHQLTPTITEASVAERLNSLVSAPYPVHVKVDTGMGRFGILPDEVVSFVRHLQQLLNLRIEGIYTHFAVADSPAAEDVAYTRQQVARFQSVLDALNRQGIQIPIRHAANSAGTMYYPDAHFDLVRPGIMIYGLRPDRDVEPAFPLQPALTIKSHVARVRTLPAGSSISYGRTFTAQQPITVALIPFGYGDGYPRLLSNRAVVLIRGQRAPLVGRVCMDQFVVDVSHIAGVQLDDEVVILGKQGDAVITADELARLAETINYEITTALLHRAPRSYVD